MTNRLPLTPPSPDVANTVGQLTNTHAPWPMSLEVSPHSAPRISAPVLGPRSIHLTRSQSTINSAPKIPIEPPPSHPPSTDFPRNASGVAFAPAPDRGCPGRGSPRWRQTRHSYVDGSYLHPQSLRTALATSKPGDLYHGIAVHRPENLRRISKSHMSDAGSGFTAMTDNRVYGDGSDVIKSQNRHASGGVSKLAQRRAYAAAAEAVPMMHRNLRSLRIDSVLQPRISVPRYRASGLEVVAGCRTGSLWRSSLPVVLIVVPPVEMVQGRQSLLV